MRRFSFLAVLLIAWTQATAAFAHASLVRADPADGAVLAQPPAVLTLTFNEPVSPLVMRVIGPGGEVAAPKVATENNVVTITPPALRQGTHALSWRVVSADGHPVGGSVVFSIGAPSGNPVEGPQDAGDPVVRASLWMAKIVIYAGLFLGIGGAFARAWLGGANAPKRLLIVALAAGLVATAASIGLQGLDALALSMAGLFQKAAWKTGFETAYGATALTAALAMIAGLVSLAATAPRVARAASLVGLAGVGLALALSGHAGTVEPRALTRSAVFLHGICIAFWIGALLPLIYALRDPDNGALARFSKAIPYALALLVVTGAALAFVQLDRIDALWTTRYGIVLSVKLAAVAVLLALGTANRYVLVPRFQRAGAAAARPLAASFRAELAIALAVFALVALWRFTPPPRALAAAHVSVHIHGPRAMAQIDVDAVRARGAQVEIMVLDGETNPLAAKEVTLAVSNPAAGIEPVRRDAVSLGDSLWRIETLRIPVAGRWRLRVEILISDFEKVVIEDQVQLPRMP